MRFGGVALLVGGATGPRFLRRMAGIRTYVDQELWGWLDPPGWVIQFIGSTLISSSDRRLQSRAASKGTGQKVILDGVPSRTPGG